MELRQRIIHELEKVQGYKGMEHETIADAILSLEPIAQALKLTVVGLPTFPDVKFGPGIAILPDGSTIEFKD